MAALYGRTRVSDGSPPIAGLRSVMAALYGRTRVSDGSPPIAGLRSVMAARQDEAL